MANSYTLLEESFTQAIGGDKLSTNIGDSSSLLASTSFIYTLLITACVAATAFVYVKGGILRMQATTNSISKSNEEFKRATLGLLGVLSLFLVLSTLNKDLLTGDVGLSNLRVGSSVANNQATTNNTNTPNNGGRSVSGLYPGDGAAILKTLNDAGIKINRGNIPCAVNQLGQASTPPPCTSVDGLPSMTVSMLKDLRIACPDPSVITVSGGTEPGHSSHGPGKTPVDISMGDTNLNSCIQKFTRSSKNPQKKSTGGDLCREVYENFGYIFCNEISTDAHWHVFQN